MRQKIFVFLLAAVFLFSQVSFVEAKGSSGGRSSSGRSSSFSSSTRSSGGYSGSSSSKSFGSSFSSKSSSGYSGSSSSKSSGFSSGSSSSTAKSSAGYTGSSSRSIPGSSSSGSSAGASKSSSGSSSGSSSSSSTKSSTFSNSKSNTLKSTYMQDTYKKQASSANYDKYKQNLNAEQRRVYDSSTNNNYRVNNRMDFDDAMRTRPQRASVFNSRPIIVNVNTSMFGGPLSYGSAFVGPWDLWFLMRASDLFWYHHWLDIYPYRDYFTASQFAQMEARIKRLEQQNLQRDPNYLDPDVDPDLQFSPDYQQNHLDNLYYTNKYSRPVNGAGVAVVIFIIIVVIIIGILVAIVRAVSRPRKKTYNSRIY